MFGSVFVDHGATFVVRDEDGKEPLVKIIKSVEQREEEIKGDDGQTVTHHYTLVKFLTPGTFCFCCQFLFFFGGGG